MAESRSESEEQVNSFRGRNELIMNDCSWHIAANETSQYFCGVGFKELVYGNFMPL